MDVPNGARGRVYRVSWLSDGARSRGLDADDLDRALADPDDEVFRLHLRSALADLGHDLRDLDDGELRAVVHGLVSARRVHVEDVTPIELRGLGVGPDDARDDDPDGPAPPSEQEYKYRLTELVEVVDRGGSLGTVGGAAGDSGKLPLHVERTERAGAACKQFINLPKDLEGASRRRPENGRFLDLRARIEWVSGDGDRSLSGKAIEWKLIFTPHGGSGRPGALDEDEQEGLGARDGTHESTSFTDGEGWARMRVHLSQYAGDELIVTAAVDPSDAEALAGPARRAGPYVSWRKLWYQLTKSSDCTAPGPVAAVDAFREVGVDLEESDVVVFAPDEPPAGTLFPRGMIEQDLADPTPVVVVGDHNQGWFWDRFRERLEHPLKTHVVLCDGQWDAEGSSPLHSFDVGARTASITFDLGVWNAGILKPALVGTITGNGRWRVTPKMRARYDAGEPGLPPRPARFAGPITDDDLRVPIPRADLGTLEVTLPDDCPDPSIYEIEVVLRASYAKFWAGKCTGTRMLVVYDGNDAMFADTVAHELGHAIEQVPPKPERTNTSLPAHPEQYDDDDGHGGQGSHCGTGATKDSPDTKFPGGRLKQGTCIMFHQQTKACSHEFCATCEPHLRLQPLDRL